MIRPRSWSLSCGGGGGEEGGAAPWGSPAGWGVLPGIVGPCAAGVRASTETPTFVPVRVGAGKDPLRLSVFSPEALASTPKC